MTVMVFCKLCLRTHRWTDAYSEYGSQVHAAEIDRDDCRDNELQNMFLDHRLPTGTPGSRQSRIKPEVALLLLSALSQNIFYPAGLTSSAGTTAPSMPWGRQRGVGQSLWVRKTFLSFKLMFSNMIKPEVLIDLVPGSRPGVIK